MATLMFPAMLLAQSPMVMLVTKGNRNVSIATYHAQNNAANVTPSVPGGALLVVVTGVNSNTAVDCSVSSSPSLTWTKRVDAGGVNTDDAEIWTAPFAAGGSVTVTTSWGQNEYFSVVYAIINNEIVLGGASGTETLASAPSVTVVTTRANSLLFGVTADWNGVDGASRTLRDAATESNYYHPNGGFTGYAYYKQATAIASHTLGLSAPTGEIAATAVLEIRGN